ncbi:uncharacterized protein TM35_000045230 [Trypanosoma theileri]|uniref:Pru domain-containing protein n=1 Tax=Trypanosoma theileri TaxID=67003 RepID=A0A1X0P6U7_9TRYP|nr:uncharacterized protein TM35_000045230 [Trypanosoma theileri]ORC92309.1 hypothetical protein TM35_000045230 [Trypanosoma theileri]
MPVKESRDECVIQFRAGKMVLKDGKVEPDKRRGILTFSKDSNGEAKMTWVSGKDEEEYKLPSGQVKFSRVEKCTTGRVLLFDFGNDKSPVFFWLQEKSTDNDAEYFSTIQELLAESRQVTGRSRAELEDFFQVILRNMGVERERDVSLVDILGSTKLLEALREDPAFFMYRLHQFLPEGTDPTSDIVEQVRNPQVSAAASYLTTALQTPDGFRGLCTSFGINGKGSGVLGFLNGLMRQSKK